MSQPAITQAIAKLEAHFGHALFQRRNARIFVTMQGDILRSRVERALRHLRVGIQRATRKRRAGIEGLVTTTQLRALLAVEEMGSFSDAARSIGIRQPSLHRSARDLEKIAALDFFKKTPQGIELTPAAQELADHTHLMFHELSMAYEDLFDHEGHDGGKIVIGTLPLARSKVLPDAINQIIKQRPNCRA